MEKIKNFLSKFKIKNKNALRHGSYAIAVTAVIIAGVILLNVFMGILSERGALTFDVTSSKVNTMSEENIEFLKSIDKKVSITVLSTEEAYSGGTMNEFSANYMGVVDDGGYYTQTVNILKQYPQINDKISLTFENFYGTKTESVNQKYPNLFYGDILIEYTDTAGKTQSRLVGFNDIYSFSDPSGYAEMGYGYYYIDANKVETAVSSAINILVSEDTKNMALIANHSNSEVFNKIYAESLKLNGFEISEINTTILQSVPENIDVLVIAAPTSDFLESEINVLGNWLKNDGKLGKSLIFIPGNSMKNYPVLKEFLVEWGIEYSDGLLYQTDKNYYYGVPTTMPMFLSTSDLTDKIAPSSGNFSLLSSNLVMRKTYDNYAARTPYIIASTNDTVTVAPEGASESWEPETGAQKGTYPGLIVTEEVNFVDNVRHTGYVAAFSSQEFVYSSWAQTNNVQNMDIAVNTAMFVSGMNSDKKVFTAKTISTQSFASEITEADTKVIETIFIVIIPLAVAVLGVVIFIRRRRK